MQRIVQNCIDGCGRQRILKYPDWFSPIPDYDHRVIDAQIVQDAIEAPIRAEAAFQAKINAAIDARLKPMAVDPDTYVMSDDNPADLNPPVWKKVWNFIFK